MASLAIFPCGRAGKGKSHLNKYKIKRGGGDAVAWLVEAYATSQKVADSIPDEVIGFFDYPNPSSRTMALGPTQSITEKVSGILL
jgi:hypothetical protein